MKEIQFDVVLKTKDLYRFTLRHTYVSLSGIFSLLISISCFILAVWHFNDYNTGTKIALFLIASLFTVIQPLLLYGKCSVQSKKSESIQGALSYLLTNQEIIVTQGENEAKVHWSDVQKMIKTKSAIYLYMSPVRAFIFPKEQCQGQFDEIAQMAVQLQKEYKNYIPDEEKEQADEQ